MSAKHILIITHSDYPIYEGLGVRVQNLCRVYVKNGHKVTIFATNFEKKRPNKELRDGCMIIRADIPIPKRLLKYRMFARAYSVILQTFSTFIIYLKYFKKDKINVIQAEHVYSIPSALIIKAFTGSKVFVDDIITVSDMLVYEGHKVFAMVFTLIEKILFKMCDEFIYTSDVCRNYILKRGGRAAIYLPNGVDCSTFKPENKKRTEKKTILFNCSTYSFQNIQAIKNFLTIGRLLKDQLDIPFMFHLICSPLQYVPSGLIHEIGKEKEWFVLEEGVPDIADSIRNADITLLPYSRGHYITGGSRLKALEYMACGSLLVSTPEGIEGINEISWKQVVISATIEDMVPILINALRDPVKFDSVAREGRSFVEENYDWDKVTVAILTRLQMD